LKASRSAAGKRILLVEDDPALAQMYGFKLQSDGYEVSTAADGESAVRAALESPPDLMVLDIRLPKMNGIQVLQALREQQRTRELPVVVLSAYNEADLIANASALGALDYLVKSEITPGKLSQLLAEWLSDATAMIPPT
jgi:CheY-like chemotaxis protein